MSVSTSVQVQIGVLLAHCTVEIVLDVPSSAVLPREVTDFCSKVTAAIINASNEARAEHAASSADGDGEKHLSEARDLLEELQVAIEPLERKLETNKATAGETAGTLVNSEPPAVDEGLMAFLARPPPQNAPGRAPLVHDEPPAQSQARRRSRHDSLEPGEILPEPQPQPQPKRMRMENGTSQAALMANNPTDGPYKNKSRKNKGKGKGKGKNPKGYWLREHSKKKANVEITQQGNGSTGSHGDNAYPNPFLPAPSYLPAATTATSMAGALQTSASYAPIPYGSTLFSYSAPTSYTPLDPYPASNAYPAPTAFSAAATAYSAPVVKTELKVEPPN